MKDKNFLTWIHERLANVYGEDRDASHMRELRGVIEATDPDQNTQVTISAEVNIEGPLAQIHECLKAHGENECVDFMHKLRDISRLEQSEDESEGLRP